MKKQLILGLLLLIPNYLSAQIKSLQDESQYLLTLRELISQSYTEHYKEPGQDEETSQYLEFDPMSMNLAFYKTPFDEDNSGKLPTDIKWLAKFVIPLYEVDAITFTEKKNTMTIRMKDSKPSIQSYMVKSGNEYYPATKEKEINIQSDKVVKIRNISHRLNWCISELQNFHQKKMKLVDFLNQKLKQEVQCQIKDSLNYRSDKKFKLVQEFQLDDSKQWLSVIVERRNIYGNPIAEKQSVMLRDVLKVGKDITVMLVSKPHSVLKTTAVKNEGVEERKIETVDEWFYLHFSYEKDNEKLRDDIISYFKQIGQDIQKSDWYD